MAFTRCRKTLSVAKLGVAALLLWGCETSQEIEVGVLWNDDIHFSNENSRYLAIVEGEFDLETGFDVTLAEFISVTPGTNAIQKWSLGSGGSSNYTAFVFIDENGNEQYDDGHDIVSGYKYNCAEENECLSISVSSFY